MKKYISDEIGVDVYGKWLAGEKVIINAPTGTGKTTFILKEILPYCKSRRKRMLILCNRKLLKMQYGFDLAEEYQSYSELEDDVDVRTYQALAEKLVDYKSMQKQLEKYDVVVCDEVHYFYADSDFNGYGTYLLFQALVLACFFKPMIMITATLQEVQPLLVKTFEECAKKLIREEKTCPNFQQYCWKNQIYDFERWGDYGRFIPFYVTDEETLVKEILNTRKKALVFIDDKKKAEQLKQQFLNIGDLESREVGILTAETLENKPNDTIVAELAINHKVSSKILITTSVLDNGVSIQDGEVGNIVIATESRISFLQMLGRVRAESVDSCNLYIFPRETEYYEKRWKQYEERREKFDDLENEELDRHPLEILYRGWYENGDKTDSLKNAIVVTEDDVQYYNAKRNSIDLKRGEIVLAVNDFAKQKVGDMLLTEKRFYKLSMEDVAQVAVEQISWIGKGSEDLVVVASPYMEERKKLLKNELLTIKEFTKNELGDKKKALSKKYRKDVLSDILVKDGSFSKDKLEKICNRFGLYLEVKSGTDKNNRYTVKEVKVDEEN